MTFLDAADLPRASFLRDSSRRYRGLSYNCDYAAQIPISRPLPQRRDSAISTSLRFAKTVLRSIPIPDLAASRAPSIAMAVALEPFTAADIPSAIDLHASTLTESPSQEQKHLRTHKWSLALESPFAKIVKATEGGNLIGAAGFLTHEVNGLQWTATERKTSIGSVEKEVDEKLAEAREEVLNGDYDLWHIYFAFVSPAYENTSVWTDMITWGLLQADEARERVYVQANAVEKHKHEKLGFEVKKVSELMMTGEDEVRYLMLRPAKI